MNYHLYYWGEVCNSNLTNKGMSMDISSMPTVEDLRLIARYAFDELRGMRPITGRGPTNDLAFAQRELKLLGAGAVYDEEYRRYELLLRGFLPPNKL